MEAEFYSTYDRMIRQVCPDYDHCLDLIAKNIPSEAVSVLDLGCGTGNLALSLLKRHPGITFYGVELQESLVKIAREKTSGMNATFLVGDILGLDWPSTDYIVSSLAVHNLNHDKKQKVFRKACETGRFFLYFDRFKGSTDKEEDENMAFLKAHMRKNGFSEQKILEAERDLRNNDEPLTRQEFQALVESIGFRYEVLYFKKGLGVYACTRNE